MVSQCQIVLQIPDNSVKSESDDTGILSKVFHFPGKISLALSGDLEHPCVRAAVQPVRSFIWLNWSRRSR
jgi:hypothetical protein